MVGDSMFFTLFGPFLAFLPEVQSVDRKVQDPSKTPVTGGTIHFLTSDDAIAAGDLSSKLDLPEAENQIPLSEIESSLERVSSKRDSALADLAEMKLEFELQESAATMEATLLRQHLEQKRDEPSHLEGEGAFLEETLKNAEGGLRAATCLLALVEGEKQELKNSLDRVFSEKDKIQEDAVVIKMTLRETEDKLSILEATIDDL